MNTPSPSPLIPEGTNPRRKVSFFVKVLMILAVHVVVIGGMLLQGCRDTKDTTATPPADATPPPADTMPPTNAITSNSISNAAAGAPTAPLSAPPAGVPSAPPSSPITAAPTGLAPITPTLPPPSPVAPPVAPVAMGDAKEYTIASGDTLGAVAKRNGVSLKALLDANPGVNPKKLQVGKKINIPAGTSSTTTATSAIPGAPAPMDAMASGDGSVYVVKSGDTLGKIAKMNHTSYKKLMAANNLKTTSIKIGEKLKIPAPSVKSLSSTSTSTGSTAPTIAPEHLSELQAPTVSSNPPLTAPVAPTGTNQ